MTITVSIPKVTGNSTESVTLEVADKTNMILIASDQDQKSGNTTAVYAITGADPGYPVSLTVNAQRVGVGSKSIRCSTTLRSWVKQTSDVTDVTEYWPIQASTSFIFEGDAPLVVTDLTKLLGTAFSYNYLSVTAGVRETTWLSKLLAGSPQLK